MLTENLLLGLLGTIVGVFVSIWTLQIARPIILSQLPLGIAGNPHVRDWRFLDLGPDYRMILFGGCSAVIAALAAGLVPALHAGQVDVIGALKGEGSSVSGESRQSRTRRRLVIAQVAVCLVLLSCAGGFARGLMKLRATDTGFEPDKVYFASFLGQNSDSLETQRRLQANPKLAADFNRRLTDTLRTVPGVAAAAQLWRMPFSGRPRTIPIKFPGQAGGEKPRFVGYNLTSAGIFETLGIPLLRGRSFTHREVERGDRVVVISETTARSLWPDAEALGQVISIGEAIVEGRDFHMEKSAPPMAYHDYEVVGVARDVRSGWLWEDEGTYLYAPLPRDSSLIASTIIRPLADSPEGISAMVAAAERFEVPIRLRGRLTAALEPQLLPYRGTAWLSGILGCLGLMMAMVGLYGVMAFSVNQRTREIGIRMALGATRQEIVRMFVRHGMRWVTAGAGLGIVGGTCFAWLLSRMIYRLSGVLDVWAIASATVLLGGVALLACWLPARRTTKVDPMIALRCE